jgi:hypothetical protein
MKRETRLLFAVANSGLLKRLTGAIMERIDPWPTITAIFSFAIAVCLQALLSSPAAAQNGTITQPGATTTLRCYEFDLKNTDPSRKLQDIHFVFPRENPQHMTFPPDWGATVTPGTAASPGNKLVFQTPPAAPPPGATVTKNPIDPGKTVGGFRFCLPVLEKGVTITLSYDTGADVAAGIFQGATVGGTVVRNAALHCATFHLTAPVESEVYDIHLDRQANGASPGFDDASLSNWTVNAGSDSLTFDAGNNAAIPGGGTRDFEVCTKTANATFDWSFTDKEHKAIPGAKGSIRVR